MKRVWRVIGVLLAMFWMACGGAPESLILATTTSTQDSGLLDVLVPVFERQSGYRVKPLAVGTGQALAMGARGEADAVLAHAPDLEMRYVSEGALANRRRVMHNDFLLVGPEGDPARIKGAARVSDALARIAGAGAVFVSRGDNSGTHLLERRLWMEAGVSPMPPWYIEAGQGMGTVLLIAAEKGGYALTDRGTYLAFKNRIGLAPVFEGDATLLNVYHVMEANPARFPKVNHAAARAFSDFLISAQAQAIIRDFGKDMFGEPLFFPN